MKTREEIRNHKPVDAYDYTLQKRNQLKDGKWGPWEQKGGGDWLGSPQLFDQLKMLKASNGSRPVEIKFELRGVGLCDATGKFTGKTIILQ